MARWTTADSEELYNIGAWGLGYFKVNDQGHLCMSVPDKEDLEVDLEQLVQDLVLRGLELPVLLRFTDLIRARVEALVGAFQDAFVEYEYQGHYRGVYPIKVNQQRHLVESLVQASRPHHLGLEAGSKPELQVCLALLDDPEALIVCNGYKDRPYIEMAVLARKLGRNVIIVIEKPAEIDLVLEVAEALDIDPIIGVRAKLTSLGAGRWKTSAGDLAKFGLTIQEIVALVERLRSVGRLDMLRLLHFHIGSQVSAIRSIKNAMKEATRIYTELVRMGAPMGYLDVGGGLGVDYDGSRTNFASSMNYDVQEYAWDVVYAVEGACSEAGIPHPNIVTESGRAMVAYNSVLVFDVLGLGTHAFIERPTAPVEEDHELLHDLWEVWEAISTKNLQAPYHDALEVKEESLMRFHLGLVSLEERAAIEQMFWTICRKLAHLAKDAEYIPEELEPISRSLADSYYCNFSLFQSAPDAWAISHLFPILPIHRLHTEPTRRAVLQDITCDSDGRLERFIDRRDVKQVLELHAPDGRPYWLGMFLIGAYQEILGDLHNLFGDTHAVHVTAVPGKRGYRLDHIIEGDAVKEVLSYVGYEKRRLLSGLRKDVERAIEEDRLTIQEGKLLLENYSRGLDSYTYLSAE